MNWVTGDAVDKKNTAILALKKAKEEEQKKLALGHTWMIKEKICLLVPPSKIKAYLKDGFKLLKK
jgi:hypothetical protein